MKISVKSRLLVNAILFLLYMESCCCVIIDRGSPDISDSVDNGNCESIRNSYFNTVRRCRCSIGHQSSIVSTNTGKLFCVANGDIDRSCKFVEVINTAIDTIHAATISDCDDGKIIQTEYWNMRRNYSGYWHNENDVKNYLTLEENSSLSLHNGLNVFTGMIVRLKINCQLHNGKTDVRCLLVKVHGPQNYPITRFAPTTQTPSTSTSTTTITTAIKTTTTIAPATTENTTKTMPSTITSIKVSALSTNAASKGSDRPLSLNSTNDDKNVVIVIATVASVATLIIIILLICIRRRDGRKQKGGQDNIVASTVQQNTGQSIYSEAQKPDVYAKFTDEYTTITFKSSPNSDGPKLQYSELGLEYQDIKPVYSELSADHQKYVDESFCRKVDEELDGGEFPQPSDAIYYTVEEENPTYEENNYYSAVETLPDELTSATAVYAKVKK